MKRIQGNKHKTGTFDANRISWSCFDDKEYILND